LQLKPSLATDLRLHFEKKYGENEWLPLIKLQRNYNTYFSDDKDDLEVPVKAAAYLRSFKKW
jgi:hypothetical protein